MALSLSKTVSQFLSERPDEKFTARYMAEWIFKNFPNECQEKKENSTFIKTNAELVQQIVAEISSQRPVLQKRNPQIKTTEGRPRRYYWTEKTDQDEVTEAEEVDIGIRPVSASSSKESDLYPPAFRVPSVRAWYLFEAY